MLTRMHEILFCFSVVSSALISPKINNSLFKAMKCVFGWRMPSTEFFYRHCDVNKQKSLNKHQLNQRYAICASNAMMELHIDYKIENYSH